MYYIAQADCMLYVCLHNYIIALLTSSNHSMNTLVSLSSVNMHIYEGAYV